MLRLSGSTQKLQALLGGAVSSTQPDVVVSYRDVGNADRTEFEPGTKLSTTNGANAVDICDAPDPATVREIDFVSIRNNDSASVTVTVRLNNNGTSYRLVRVTLATLEHLYYSHVAGWYVIGTRGQLKNSITGLFDLSASTAGQIKFPATQNGSADANTLDDYEEVTDLSIAGSVASSVGTITTVGTSTISYTKTGRQVDWQAYISITTNGTGAGLIGFTFPFTVGGLAPIHGTTATAALGALTGYINGTSAVFALYDGTYPGADGEQLLVGGTAYV